ncbi:MAG: cytochrome c family protein [Alphaproteobacteria bacterium]|nr:cytochrome c family protein [Alphaproteobacteria bacterium]MDE2631334.1 cytochrome c family protein [Alphaproteobacteria bacterium]
MARSPMMISGLRCALLACALALVPAAVAGQGSPTAGDPVKGADVFQRCTLCHTINKDEGNKIGPNLFGIVGRKAGTAPGFAYSAALKDSGIIWTDAKLKEWVGGPQKMVPGTSMALVGSLDGQQTDDLIAYLNTKK